MTDTTRVGSELEGALRRVIEKLSTVPEDYSGVAVMADTRLLQNFLTEARIRQFTLQVDEPPSLGGSDQAPNPVELVLAAMGTCQEIVYALYAALLGIELRELEIAVSGRLDGRGFLGLADVPVGLRTVDMQTRIESDEPPERIRDLIELAQRHCPVLDILQRPLEVRNAIELNGTPLD